MDPDLRNAESLYEGEYAAPSLLRGREAKLWSTAVHPDTRTPVKQGLSQVPQ